MLCPFCAMEYTMDAPCFCYTAVRTTPVPKVPITLDIVSPAGEFNFAVLANFDLGFAAPYLGA